MLIYYLQSIARSLKFTNNQLRMKIQAVSRAQSTFTYKLVGSQESASLINVTFSISQCKSNLPLQYCMQYWIYFLVHNNLLTLLNTF